MKSSNFNLLELTNYNKKFKKNINFYINEYIVLMKEFIEYFDKYVIYNNYKKFYIILKGIQSITHIFLMLLLYTKNLSLTLFHCKKSFLYYIEFISQIGDEGNSYLQLNSKDAILFIYKKSIFEINNEIKSVMEISCNDQELIDEIKKFTQIFNNIYFYIIENIVKDEKNKNDKKIINKFLKFLELINKRKKDDEYLFDKILIIVEKLNFEKTENSLYFDSIKTIIKKKKFKNLTKEEFEYNFKKI